MNKRVMRNPQKWIGKKIPRDMEYDWKEHDKCDDCQCLWFVYGENGNQGLHQLLDPRSEQDFELQEKLGIEEAQSFCPTCLEAIENEADEIDRNWRERHGY